jgi:outer membrane lipoprotein LolB
MRYLFLLVLLFGCTQLPPLPTTPVSQLDSWRLTGRIAILTGHDSWIAKIYWHQQGTTYQIRLNGPTGQGALLIKGNSNGVMIHTADHKTFEAPDPDALIQKVLKLEIPLSHLHAWIRGLPYPNSSPESYTLNKAGQLQHLRQDNWRIKYDSYIKVHGLDLPKKIVIENTRFKLKIAISHWDLGQLKGVVPTI